MPGWIRTARGGGGAFAEMGDLSDVTIDGDTAKAVSKTEFGDQPIEFRKTENGWVVHLPIGGPARVTPHSFVETATTAANRRCDHIVRANMLATRVFHDPLRGDDDAVG